MKLAGAYISDEKHAQLVSLAENHNITLAALCRRIYDAALIECPDQTLTWITDGTLPDSDITVLICDALDGEVDTGFHDGKAWRWCYDGSRVGGPIKGWADLPEGPKP